MPETEKRKALLKWQPSDKYRDEFDRIFKKTCAKCGGEVVPCQLMSYPPISYYTCSKCGDMRDSKVISTGDDFKVI